MPASCGELIGAGFWAAKLVSCPVEWYSTVEVSSGSPLADERPLSRAMVERLLQHWQYPAHVSQDIRIDIHSTIPIAKGMASSTADIAATAIATAHHLGHQLDEATLAQLCVSLEPTDSTVFRQLTLLIITTHPLRSPVKRSPTSTCWFSKARKRYARQTITGSRAKAGLQAGAPALKRAWEKVQEACSSQNPYRMGEAATLSAIASQMLLPKPDFDSLLSLVEECDLYGVNVAHSGSVVGLMLDRTRHDIDYIKWMLVQKN